MWAPEAGLHDSQTRLGTEHYSAEREEQVSSRDSSPLLPQPASCHLQRLGSRVAQTFKLLGSRRNNSTLLTEPFRADEPASYAIAKSSAHRWAVSSSSSLGPDMRAAALAPHLPSSSPLLRLLLQHLLHSLPRSARTAEYSVLGLPACFPSTPTDSPLLGLRQNSVPSFGADKCRWCRHPAPLTQTLNWPPGESDLATSHR